MDDIPPRNLITCAPNGTTYSGKYWVAGKILTVTTGRGGKSRQVGAFTPQVLAAQLLQQLAQEGKA